MLATNAGPFTTDMDPLNVEHTEAKVLEILRSIKKDIDAAILNLESNGQIEIVKENEIGEIPGAGEIFVGRWTVKLRK